MNIYKAENGGNNYFLNRTDRYGHVNRKFSYHKFFLKHIV